MTYKRLVEILEDINTPEYKSDLELSLTPRRYEFNRIKESGYPDKEEMIDYIFRALNKFTSVKEGFKEEFASTLEYMEIRDVFQGLQYLLSSKKDSSTSIYECLEHIMNRLDDWEKVIFFAGIKAEMEVEGKQLLGVLKRIKEANIESKISSMDVPEIIGNYIKWGYDYIHEWHSKKFNCGTYNRELKLPGSERYHLRNKVTSQLELI